MNMHSILFFREKVESAVSDFEYCRAQSLELIS